MKKTAFDRLLEFYGTHEIMAKAFKMTRQNITNWKINGIPALRAMEVETKTKGLISAMDVLRG